MQGGFCFRARLVPTVIFSYPGVTPKAGNESGNLFPKPGWIYRCVGVQRHRHGVHIPVKTQFEVHSAVKSALALGKLVSIYTFAISSYLVVPDVATTTCSCHGTIYTLYYSVKPSRYTRIATAPGVRRTAI